MSEKHFADELCAAIRMKKSILVGGLDPQFAYMPPHLKREVVLHYGRTFEAVGRMFYEFNSRIIDAICDVVVAVKPNLAFYEAYGHWGIWAFEKTIEYAKTKGVLCIADGKRSDGGDTVEAYADTYLGDVPFFGCEDPSDFTRIDSPMRSDCLTVMPYIGDACVSPFVKRVLEFGTGIFVVTKTSFKPNSRVEQIQTQIAEMVTIPVWEKVAEMVEQWGTATEGAYGLRNVGVVLGATYPEDVPAMRKILPHSFLLKPGYGGQGASAADSVAGIRQDGFGVVVNNSRNLTFAWQNKKGKYQCEPENFAESARFQAIDNQNELAAAAKEASCWPF